jgi:hypothetical protein
VTPPDMGILVFSASRTQADRHQTCGGASLAFTICWSHWNVSLQELCVAGPICLSPGFSHGWLTSEAAAGLQARSQSLCLPGAGRCRSGTPGGVTPALQRRMNICPRYPKTARGRVHIVAAPGRVEQSTKGCGATGGSSAG